MTDKWRYVRGKISPALARSLIAVIPKFSRPALLALGARLGTLMYYLSRSHRRRSLDNLNIVFGASKTFNEKKTLAQTAFQNFAKSGIEMAMYHSLPGSVLREHVVIEGKEHLDRALERGMGVIGLTAHFGNFILLHGRLGVEGYAINTVVKALRDTGVEEILQRMRSGQGIKTIYVSPMAQCVRACNAALASNEILVLLNDQPYKRGVKVDFFGVPAWTATGPASLALATDAAVVPMFIIRNPDDTHRLVISDAVPLVRTENRKQDILANTQAFTRITESYVSRYPEQWAWNQRRWRRWGK